MTEYLSIIEVALRGGASGVNLLIAGLIATSAAPRLKRWLCVLFILGTVAYILQSSSADVLPMAGWFDGVTKAMAILNTVFFWWFALSLFDDDFHWTPLKFAPLAAIILLHLPLPGWSLEEANRTELFLHSSLSVILLGHAVWIALKNRSDDLVDPRRRFRLAFAAGIGGVGIIIAIGENVHAAGGLPPWITLFHAIALSALTFFFAFWMLKADPALFAPVKRPDAAVPGEQAGSLPKTIDTGSDPAFVQLSALMDKGVYKEEGMTVARLAGKVGVPEHQLRRLINQELGFRNFSAFLNERRVADAKKALADPAQAKKQVLQIALDLGYGSIAPFNRAFKSATGKTPTEFRREKLNGG